MGGESESKQVEMMRMTQEMTFAILDEFDCTMVELPYRGERVVMQVLLPNKRTGVWRWSWVCPSSNCPTVCPCLTVSRSWGWETCSLTERTSRGSLETGASTSLKFSRRFLWRSMRREARRPQPPEW